VTRVRQTLRFALDPTVAQRSDLARHAGTARYAYKWGPDRVKAAMDAHQAGVSDAKIPSARSLHRVWNSWKRSPEGIPWWVEVSKCAPQEAFRNLERGMRAFWASRRRERGGQPVRFPLSECCSICFGVLTNRSRCLV
jgi:putative transposase